MGARIGSPPRRTPLSRQIMPFCCSVPVVINVLGCIILLSSTLTLPGAPLLCVALPMKQKTFGPPGFSHDETTSKSPNEAILSRLQAYTGSIFAHLPDEVLSITERQIVLWLILPLFLKGSWSILEPGSFSTERRHRSSFE
jgi:hypothetical protein